MKKVKRRRLLTLLLVAMLLLLTPTKVMAAPPPTTTGVTQETFDAKRYADTYADLKKAFGYDEAKLWNHYLTFGIKENRKVYTKGSDTPVETSAVLTRETFDAKRYADTYADLKKAFGYDEAKLWNHYQTYGIKEHRKVYAKGASAPATTTKAQTATKAVAAAPAGITRETFDAKRYADTYADLKKAFGYDEAKLWNHYQTYGIKENRKVYAKGSNTPVSQPQKSAVTNQNSAPAAGNFLSREGGTQIGQYAYSIGLISDYSPPQQPTPGYYVTTFSFRKEGWSVGAFSFSLLPGNNYWICRAHPAVLTEPIASTNAYSLEDVKAFINRFKN